MSIHVLGVALALAAVARLLGGVVLRAAGRLCVVGAVVGFIFGVGGGALLTLGLGVALWGLGQLHRTLRRAASGAC